MIVDGSQGCFKENRVSCFSYYFSIANIYWLMGRHHFLNFKLFFMKINCNNKYCVMKNKCTRFIRLQSNPKLYANTITPENNNKNNFNCKSFINDK